MNYSSSSWKRVSRSVRDFIDTHHLFSHEDRVLVAVSGGPDSIFLLHILHYLEYELGIAHVNYQLRGADSDSEEAIIHQLADAWKLPVWIKKVNTRILVEEGNESLQMIAREQRYTFFEELLNREDFDVCATAHHAGDDMETIFLSFLKGNQFDLFQRIPYKRDRYVRPLIQTTKQDILDALHDAGVSYSIDYTNFQNVYLRNRIRNQIIPTAAEINPNLQHHILSRVAWYEQQIGMLRQILSEWYEAAVEEDAVLKKLGDVKFRQSNLREYIQVFYAYVLSRWGLHGHLLWESVGLCDSMTGKQVDLPDGRTIYRTREGLEMFVLTDTSQWNYTWMQVSEKAIIKVPFRRNFLIVKKYNTVKNIYKNPRSLCMDLSKLSFPVVFRTWHEGDKMIPLGMKHPKKISDIFIDEKYSPHEKYTAIVVESQGVIIGLMGFRVADTVKIDENTREMIEIQWG